MYKCVNKCCQGVATGKCGGGKALEEDVTAGKEMRGLGREEEWVGASVMLGGRDIKKICEGRGEGTKKVMGLGGVVGVMRRED